ncbi:MAG: class I SAM-dependent methyltransferase [Candidatus Tectomicrobia bacterium]|nr:class I SAM-dependent methyltransferase [Candidatus Tectomicrobia bacterium]
MAETLVTPSNGVIVDADTAFNTYYQWTIGGSSSSRDIQNVMTHEFGHWVFLFDLTGYWDKDLTMYQAIPNGETKKRTLEMVEQAEARNAKAIAAGKVALRRGTVERLPFEPATFDKALAINSMQVWPDAVAGLREIRRVLKPGGRVALGFTRWSGQARAGLAEALTAAGFTDAHMVDIDGDYCALAVTPVTEATNRPSKNGV